MLDDNKVHRSEIVNERGDIILPESLKGVFKEE